VYNLGLWLALKQRAKLGEKAARAIKEELTESDG
jgi:hypothetical protein